MHTLTFIRAVNPIEMSKELMLDTIFVSFSEWSFLQEVIIEWLEQIVHYLLRSSIFVCFNPYNFYLSDLTSLSIVLIGFQFYILSDSFLYSIRFIYICNIRPSLLSALHQSHLNSRHVLLQFLTFLELQYLSNLSLY